MALARVALLHFVHLQRPHEDARLGRLLQQAVVNIREDRKGGAPGVAEPHSNPVAPRIGSAVRLQARMSRPQGLLVCLGQRPKRSPPNGASTFQWELLKEGFAVGNDCVTKRSRREGETVTAVNERGRWGVPRACIGCSVWIVGWGKEK